MQFIMYNCTTNHMHDQNKLNVYCNLRHKLNMYWNSNMRPKLIKLHNMHMYTEETAGTPTATFPDVRMRLAMELHIYIALAIDHEEAQA